MRSRLLALATILAFVGAIGAPRAHAQDADHLPAQVDSIAAAVLDATGVPSASVAVVRHGALAYTHAYGMAKLDPRTPSDTTMRYAIGSISKQFTAAAILLLVQDHKLSLDDPVSKFVPGLARGNDVTVRMLLSHTSGYQDFWPQDYVPPSMEQPTTPQHIIDRWAKQPLDFEPGTQWQYSNTNYIIAGLIVEKASGTPFTRFIHAKILDALGMKSAVDFDALGPSAAQPIGYMRYGLGPLRPATPTGPGWMFGAGELAMTPTDLAKWDIAMIDQSLLAPSSYKTMETTVLLKNGVSSNYGLGVDVGQLGGRRVISHSGEVSGFTAENIVFPDDSAAIVVLTNQDAAPASGAIAQQIARVMFTAPDTLTASRTARARAIFDGLQKGTVDRSYFTADANAYFSAQALQDFGAGLAPLGTPASFVQIGQTSRGGMIERVYRVSFAGRVLRVWTYEMPNGQLEQYQVAPTS
ncbi:MAG TPA: serine hydrolase domain-containing protein [Gemmatimonadaceae bacterium]|nr:serine hydrolase domain-containing protein [Gemmatimonadaceae bacterium]